MIHFLVIRSSVDSTRTSSFTRLGVTCVQFLVQPGSQHDLSVYDALLPLSTDFPLSLSTNRSAFCSMGTVRYNCSLTGTSYWLGFFVMLSNVILGHHTRNGNKTFSRDTHQEKEGDEEEEEDQDSRAFFFASQYGVSQTQRTVDTP